MCRIRPAFEASLSRLRKWRCPSLLSRWRAAMFSICGNSPLRASPIMSAEASRPADGRGNEVSVRAVGPGRKNEFRPTSLATFGGSKDAGEKEDAEDSWEERPRRKTKRSVRFLPRTFPFLRAHRPPSPCARSPSDATRVGSKARNIADASSTRGQATGRLAGFPPSPIIIPRRRLFTRRPCWRRALSSCPSS